MTALDTPTSPVIKASRRRSRGKKPIKGATIWLHRWTSLVLGLLLLLITTTGALVIYTPEWTKWTNGSVFHVTKSAAPIGVDKAIEVVAAAHPDFDPGGVNVYAGLYEVTSADSDAHPGFWGVDPGTGKITGWTNPDRGVTAFMNQVHECFFTCDDQPGYVSWLNDPLPGNLHVEAGLTWSSFILGAFGVFLLLLGVSGIWLWWPGIKRWRHGFRVRMDKGRYARDYDLHQVIGMAAIPFLLMWGLTGASFKFHWVKTAWYDVTGGQQTPDDEFVSRALPKGSTTPDIGLNAAIAAAKDKAGPRGRLVYASSPGKDDPTSTYAFYFARGFDQYRHGAYPGSYGVDVDRHDATNVHVDDLGTAPTLSNRLMDDYAAPLFHYGQSVNGWWRAIWFAFGLTPLALAATGVSTWLAKRSVRKRRAAAAVEG